LIWRDVYVECEVDTADLRAHLAAVFGVKPHGVAVVPDEVAMPVAGSHAVVAVVRACPGDYQHMLSIYLFGDQDAVERLDERLVLQALARRLGCAILLPAEGPDPYRFVRFSPLRLAEEVIVEPEPFEEHGAVRVTTAENGNA
jgi:hypothetical protein